jgi:hypothetical protein
VTLRDRDLGQRMSVQCMGERRRQSIFRSWRRTHLESIVLVARWRMFLEVSIPTLNLGDYMGHLLEIALLPF